MKKKTYLFILTTLSLIFMLSACHTHDDDEVKCEHEIILQPDADNAKDAIVWTEEPNNNFGHHPDAGAMAWTWYAHGYDGGVTRGLLDFDLSSIPSSAVIQSAELTLFHNSLSGNNSGKHASRSGSNAMELVRITDSWTETGVTWNNQPNTTSTDAVTLAQSTSATQDYTDMDITEFVKFWHANPSLNHGLMTKLLNENFYRCVILASSDCSNSAFHPKLKITYLK